jgi:hypothetical protein
MSRDSVNRVIQIGLETTRGVAVAGNKLLTATSFDLNVEIESKEVETQGFKYATDVLVSKVFGKGTFEGYLSYTEFLYHLAMLYGTGAKTTPGGATNARQWAITANARGADDYKTFTIEEGDGQAATVMSHVAATDLELDFGEPDIKVKGSILGKTPVSGALSANPVSIPKQLVTARHIDVYVSTSLATLFQSANKITDALKESFKIGKVRKERFVHNTDFQSFKELVDLRPDIDFMFSQEHNAQSRALYDACIASAFRYVGLRATGPQIEAGQNHLIELTMATKIVPEKRDDIDGIYAYGYKCKPIYDDTLGTSHKWRIINTIDAL